MPTTRTGPAQVAKGTESTEPHAKGQGSTRPACTVQRGKRKAKVSVWCHNYCKSSTPKPGTCSTEHLLRHQVGPAHRMCCIGVVLEQSRTTTNEGILRQQLQSVHNQARLAAPWLQIASMPSPNNNKFVAEIKQGQQQLLANFRTRPQGYVADQGDVCFTTRDKCMLSDSHLSIKQ